MVAPVLRRTASIVLLQRLLIILPLVSEQRAEFTDVGRVLDQVIPVIVRDLVAEMPEQRAVGLGHIVALPLALDVVGLSQIDGDDTAGVTGRHRTARRRRKDIESEPLWILRL